MKRQIFFLVLLLFILSGCGSDPQYQTQIFREDGPGTYTKWIIEGKPEKIGAFACFDDKCISGKITIISTLIEPVKEKKDDKK